MVKWLNIQCDQSTRTAWQDKVLQKVGKVLNSYSKHCVKVKRCKRCFVHVPGSRGRYTEVCCCNTTECRSLKCWNTFARYSRLRSLRFCSAWGKRCVYIEAWTLTASKSLELFLKAAAGWSLETPPRIKAHNANISCSDRRTSACAVWTDFSCNRKWKYEKEALLFFCFWCLCWWGQ